MRFGVIGLLVLGVTMASPVTGYGQEATLSGTVSDATGGVLPGVTVTAVHEASGNTFVGVTDERGAFRLPVRTGVYRLTLELSGFATLTRSGVELLVGQTAVVNLQMAPSAIQESVTVTGEAPLLDVTQSSMGGNIDPRQMQELPVNGRNWQDLAMLAPGSRANASGDSPIPRESGAYQINMDGQQITNIVAGSGFGNPRYSRDAIAEFEFITNRFDATQGRSAGVQVNAISKSGTNTPTGSLSGYFRDERFNAADPVAKRVLPYSDQQISTTFGGPIRRDRLHFFANYEYEREPQTFVYTTPFPAFNFDQTGTRREHKAGVRLDAQFSPQTRLAFRASKWKHILPYDLRYTGGGDKTPSSAVGLDRGMNQLLATLTNVLGTRSVNEVKVGYAGYDWNEYSYVNWANHPLSELRVGAPSIQLRGLTIGETHNQTPQIIGQETYSVRDDFVISFNKGGRHDVKLGGEYIYNMMWMFVCNRCNGTLDAQGGPIPANIESLFPNLMDVSTWNLAPLSSVTRKYTLGVGTFREYAPRDVYAGWVQDDWAITSRLTLNVGLRYDLETGVFGQWLALPPFLEADRPEDKDNFGPRLGFAFKLNDRTVIRGGAGKYFAEVTGQPSFWLIRYTHQIHPEILNDGRPDFAANPFNGPVPTFEQARAQTCAVTPGPNCVRQAIPSQLAAPDLQIAHSWQSSIGVQRQIGAMTAVEIDYVFTGGRHEIFTRPNANLSYNPVTGVNYPFTDIGRRPYPDYGLINQFRSEGWSNYHALSAAVTKRFSQRWQASGTYLLSGVWDAQSSPAPFKVAPDLGGEYSRAASDQRHRAVFNGIWQAGYGFQLSGLSFFGSGERYANTYGGDLRLTGATGGRLRPDGTIVPRNSFVGKPLHRVDVRVLRRFPLAGRAGIDGIVEVFNLFNHANYGSYVIQESARNYGQPTRNLNVAYQPRMLQLGFRFTF
ncbi:MAG: TonB-dependent receptor [Acidobacteria bacterium]|nr:TonB-dependent receptor [Acidobacteriota bacterium]